MFSTRKPLASSPVVQSLALSIAAVSAIAITGCQKTRPAPVAKLIDSPVLVDEAMQKRDWEQSNAYYANGDTIAGFSGRYFEPRDRFSEGYFGRLADPAVGLTNVVIMPITMAVTPPWKGVDYQGVIVPPTHSANPPVEVIK